mgnify:CR=1 FL=1|tara:strand:- start:209 stop:451 length:243 start_codon:yes stop_codon:yes gene_type:complete
MIANYIKRLMGQRTEGKDFANITFQLQKQILKRRYTEGKQNELYRKQPKFSQPVVRYANLTNKDTENVILFKKKKLKKLS